MSLPLQPSAQRTNRVTRQACNRCHMSKLRCPRPAGPSNSACARCLKAGAECVYDPPQRLGRPRQKSRVRMSPARSVQAMEPDTTSSSRSSSGGWDNTERLTAPSTPDTRPGLQEIGRTSAVNLGTVKINSTFDSTECPIDKEVACDGMDFVDLFQLGSTPLDPELFCSESLDHGFDFDFIHTSPKLQPSPLQDRPPTGKKTDSTQTNTPNITISAPESTEFTSSTSTADHTSEKQDDYVLDLIQLQAEANRHAKELRKIIGKAQDPRIISGQNGFVQISAECLKAHMDINLGISERMLKGLQRIHQGLGRGLQDTTWQPQLHLTPKNSPLSNGSHTPDYSGYFHHRRDSDRAALSWAMGQNMSLEDSVAERLPVDPLDNIVAFLALSTYLRLLQNFEHLTSVLSDQLRHSTSQRDSGRRTTATANQPPDSAPDLFHGQTLDDSCFGPSSMSSLQTVVHVQLATVVLSKIKVALHRIIVTLEVQDDSIRDQFCHLNRPQQHTEVSFRPDVLSGSPCSWTPNNHRGCFNGPYCPHMVDTQPPNHTLRGATHFRCRSSTGPFQSPSMLGPGLDRILQKTLSDVDHLEGNLQARAKAIQQWSLEGF